MTKVVARPHGVFSFLKFHTKRFSLFSHLLINRLIERPRDLRFYWNYRKYARYIIKLINNNIVYTKTKKVGVMYILNLYLNLAIRRLTL